MSGQTSDSGAFDLITDKILLWNKINCGEARDNYENSPLEIPVSIQAARTRNLSNGLRGDRNHLSTTGGIAYHHQPAPDAPTGPPDIELGQFMIGKEDRSFVRVVGYFLKVSIQGIPPQGRQVRVRMREIDSVAFNDSRLTRSPGPAGVVHACLHDFVRIRRLDRFQPAVPLQIGPARMPQPSPLPKHVLAQAGGFTRTQAGIPLLPLTLDHFQVPAFPHGFDPVIPVVIRGHDRGHIPTEEVAEHRQ